MAERYELQRAFKHESALEAQQGVLFMLYPKLVGNTSCHQTSKKKEEKKSQRFAAIEDSVSSVRVGGAEDVSTFVVVAFLLVPVGLSAS
eukprot:scaffold33820_cov51-Attheya_sp.AAC.3